MERMKLILVGRDHPYMGDLAEGHTRVGYLILRHFDFHVCPTLHSFGLFTKWYWWFLTFYPKI